MCGGNIIHEKTSSLDNTVLTTRLIDEGVVIILKYFWGLDYTIDQYNKSECSFDKVDYSILCSRGEHDTPNFRYVKFNIDTSRFFSEWSFVSDNTKSTYRTDFLNGQSCQRITTAFDN